MATDQVLDKTRAQSAHQGDASPLQDWAVKQAYGSDSRSIVAPTAVAASDKPTTQDSGVHDIMQGFSISAGTVDSQVQKLDAKAGQSAAVAIADLGYKLWSDPALLRKITDGKGNITKESVLNVMGANAASESSRVKGGGAAPVLDERQKATLDFAMSHAGALAEGLSSAAIKSLDPSNLNKLLDKNGNPDPNKVADIARIIVQQAESSGGFVSSPDHSGDVTYGAAPEGGTRTHDVPQVAGSEFSDAAKRVLQRIDPTGKGVTKAQLAKAMEDPSYKGTDAQVLAAMYQNFDGLQNLSNHEGLFDTKTITAGDLDKYEQIERKQEQNVNDAYAMKEWAHSNLSKYGHGDSISYSDVQKALNDPKTPEADKQMLKKINDHWSDLGEYYGYGSAKLSDFDTYADKIFTDSKDANLVTNVNWACERTANGAQRAGDSSNLYGTTNPIDSIKPDAIEQGMIGDCYFEASLAALAKAHPEQIRDMIKDNHNGTYTVTFPGDKAHPVTVKAPTEAELGVYNAGGKDGVWASVMEKAFGQYKNENAWFFHSDVPEDAADGGGWPSDVLKLLTNRDVDTVSNSSMSQSDMANKLQQAFSSNPPKAVEATSNDTFANEWFDGGRDTTANGFIDNHAFTIVGFTPDGHGGGSVKIRNPWAGTDGTTEGTIEVPLDEFMRNFQQTNIEK